MIKYTHFDKNIAQNIPPGCRGLIGLNKDRYPDLSQINSKIKYAEQKYILRKTKSLKNAPITT